MKRIPNPEDQAGLHMATEALSAFVLAPMVGYIALANPQMPAWQRYALYAIATGTIVVDGYLLTQWARR